MIRRYRFKVTDEDPRPTNWPLPYPYWITGYDSSDYATIVAYGESDDYIESEWPSALRPLDYEEVVGVEFSSRFPRPEWWKE